MKFSFKIHAFQLQFRYPFRIAHGERAGTQAVFVEGMVNGSSFYGEATLPPYREETVETVRSVFEQVSKMEFADGWNTTAVMRSVQAQIPNHYAAKAALDMLLWRMQAAAENKKLSSFFPNAAAREPLCTFTIGVCDEAAMKARIAFGREAGFQLFKLKLDGDEDAARVRCYTQHCNLPFAIDANSSWKRMQQATELLPLLERTNCVLIEQPFAAGEWKLPAQLKAQTPLPVIADESFQTMDDLEAAANSFSGINIKLMKCGGMAAAVEIARAAEAIPSFKILVGCMSESACGCSMASFLSPAAHWLDLDGPWLNVNDPFQQPTLRNGKLVVQDAPLRGTLA